MSGVTPLVYRIPDTGGTVTLEFPNMWPSRPVEWERVVGHAPSEQMLHPLTQRCQVAISLRAAIIA
jgi:hypothetical protein